MNSKFILNLLITAISLLLFGCGTLNQKQPQWPSGYKLVVNHDQIIKVQCPNGYITGPQWKTEYCAKEYAFWHYTCIYPDDL